MSELVVHLRPTLAAAFESSIDTPERAVGFLVGLPTLVWVGFTAFGSGLFFGTRLDPFILWVAVLAVLAPPLVRYLGLRESIAIRSGQLVRRRTWFGLGESRTVPLEQVREWRLRDLRPWEPDRTLVFVEAALVDGSCLALAAGMTTSREPQFALLAQLEAAWAGRASDNPGAGLYSG